MKLLELRASLNTPSAGDRVSGDRETEPAAYSEIIAACQTEHIGDRSVAPGKSEHGGQKARGSSAHAPGQPKHACLLHHHAGAPWGRLEVQAPIARCFLFRWSPTRPQKRRKLFIATLKVDAPAVHFNLAEARCRWHGGQTLGSRIRGLGKPRTARFHSPRALRTRFKVGRVSESVPHSRRPRSRLRQRSLKLRDSARRKYSRPKRGIHPRSLTVLQKCRPSPQGEIVAAHLHRPAEGGFEMGGQVRARAGWCDRSGWKSPCRQARG